MKGPKVHKNFINGRWVKSRANKAFEDVNPASIDDVVGVFRPAGAAFLVRYVWEASAI